MNHSYPNPVSKILENLEREYESATSTVRAVLGSRFPIDEMALYFSEPNGLLQWIDEVVREDGYELFNVAEDTVHVSPLPSSYDVAYWFVRCPRPYRIEAMTLTSGHSPYHYLFSHGTGPYVIHASFKTSTEEEYATTVHALTQSGYEVWQRCTSSYGRFTYLGDESGDVVLKARINMRDGS